jgi:4-hydroxy-tetrahydrodipicolinate synthase
MNTLLKGTGVALVTPFKSDQSIDFDGVKKLVNYLGAEGIEYLVVMGTTGEAATLNKSEKRAVLDTVLQHNPYQLPVVYGLGGNDTRSLKEELQHLDLTGISALLSVSPYYNKPSQSGIVAHYQTLADASTLPIVLYNVPGRTGSNLSAATTATLAKHPNIVGIKEASGDLIQCLEIKASTPDDFLLISGDDLLTPAMISMGAVGAISVLANAYPAVFGQMVRLALEGQFTKSHALAQKMLALNRLMYLEGNPTGVKALLQALGLSAPHVRAPMAEASAELKNNISKNLIK